MNLVNFLCTYPNFPVSNRTECLISIYSGPLPHIYVVQKFFPFIFNTFYWPSQCPTFMNYVVLQHSPVCSLCSSLQHSLFQRTWMYVFIDWWQTTAIWFTSLDLAMCIFPPFVVTVAHYWRLPHNLDDFLRCNLLMRRVFINKRKISDWSYDLVLYFFNGNLEYVVHIHACVHPLFTLFTEVHHFYFPSSPLY